MLVFHFVEIPSSGIVDHYCLNFLHYYTITTHVLLIENNLHTK